MDTRAVVDTYRRLQVNRVVHADIMGSDVNSNQWNELNTDDILQVFTDQRMGDMQYYLICLDVEGDIILVNRNYPEGRKLRLPDNVGRVIYITLFTSNNQRVLSFVNEAYHIRHIFVNDIIDRINSNEVLNLELLQDPFAVISVMVNGDTIQWIDDHHYLNYARVDRGRIITNHVESLIQPVRLRHGYMIDSDNNVYKIDRDLRTYQLFSYDTSIIDICKGYPSPVTSVLNEDGTMSNYYDSEYNDTIEANDIYKFVSSMNGNNDMYIELIDGRILTKEHPRLVDIPDDGVYIVDELPRDEDRIKSAMTDLRYN